MSFKYGDILAELINGLKDNSISPTKMEEMQRGFNELWDRDSKYRDMLTLEQGVIKLRRIVAQETEFLVSPARSIVFSITTVTSIPNSSYTVIDFTDTRGLINEQQTTNLGCVKWVPGYTDRFTKQDWVPAEYPIFFFGDFGFGSNGNGSREIYIEFFDKADASLGGYTFTARPPASNWTNMAFNFMDWFDDGDYCKFWVWQDSGSPLSITSANFGFMLG